MNAPASVPANLYAWPLKLEFHFILTCHAFSFLFVNQAKLFLAPGVFENRQQTGCDRNLLLLRIQGLQDLNYLLSCPEQNTFAKKKRWKPENLSAPTKNSGVRFPVIAILNTAGERGQMKEQVEEELRTAGFH